MKKFCANCKEPFQSQRSSKLYCSDHCKQQAFYKRSVLASTNHGKEIPLAGLSNAMDTEHCNRSELVNRLTAILNDFIDQEIERRIGQPPYAATANKPVNVKRKQTLSDNQDDEYADHVEPENEDWLAGNESASREADSEDELNAQEPVNVKRDIASNRNRDLSSNGNNKPVNVKRNHTVNANQNNEYASDVESENEDWLEDNESASREADNEDELNAQEPVNVKRDIASNRNRDLSNGNDKPVNVKRNHTVNGNQNDEYASDVESENEDWLEDNESASQEADYKDELDAQEPINVKRNATLNRNCDLRKNKPVNGKRTQTVDDNQDQDDEYTHDVEPENGDSLVDNESASREADYENELAPREPVNVKQFSTGHKPANTKRSAENNPVNHPKIKPDNGIGENWVFSTFTRTIHDYVFYRTDYTELIDNGNRQVLEVFKCLIKHLLCLSNCKPVSRQNLLVLTEIFTKLRHSIPFQSLPPEFPHYELIVQLTKKIQAREKASRKHPVKLRFTLKFRTELYAILYAMDGKIRDIGIGQIKFAKPGRIPEPYNKRFAATVGRS